MVEKTFKRFYKEVRFEEEKGNFFVFLDSYDLKTPMKKKAFLPTKYLAEKVVAEWDAVKEEIDPDKMPYTRITFSTLDKAGDVRKAISDDFFSWIQGDTALYRASQDEELEALQNRLHQPVLDWLKEGYNWEAVPSGDFSPPSLQKDIIEKIQKEWLSCADWQLVALVFLSSLLESPLWSTMILLKKTSFEEAFKACYVEEDYQSEKWGEVDVRLEKRQDRFEEAKVSTDFLL